MRAVPSPAGARSRTSARSVSRPRRPASAGSTRRPTTDPRSSPTGRMSPERPPPRRCRRQERRRDRSPNVMRSAPVRPSHSGRRARGRILEPHPRPAIACRESDYRRVTRNPETDLRAIPCSKGGSNAPATRSEGFEIARSVSSRSAGAEFRGFRHAIDALVGRADAVSTLRAELRVRAAEFPCPSPGRLGVARLSDRPDAGFRTTLRTGHRFPRIGC